MGSTFHDHQSFIQSHNFEFIHCEDNVDDAYLIMTWRNDPLTLRMSYHSLPKKWPAFYDEYRSNYINDPKYPSYFAFSNNTKVAFIRISKPDDPKYAEENFGQINIMLDPNYRFLGFGTKILTQFISYMNTVGTYSGLYAEIKKENEPSKRAFKKAGFALTDEIEKYIQDIPETFAIERYIRTLIKN